VTQGGGGGAAGQGAGQLATTGSGPMGLEALLGALLAALGAAMLKPKEIWRRFVR